MEQGPLGKPDYGRIQHVDGLRAIACLIVLCAHLLTLSDQYAAYASGCGKIGVWFFMMISGYCSVKPYLDGKKIRAKQLPKYYLKKIIKVYPLYIVSLGLVFALDLIDLRTAFLSLILAGTWGHFWFMPVILKFYLIFPLVLFIYDFGILF